MLFFTVLVTIILAGMEIDLFTPSFPELEKLFHLTPFSLQLMLSLNFVGYALSSVVIGFLGDRFGRRPMILLSLLLFIVGSLFCVFSPHYWVLLLGRFLQGLGMSGPMVLAYVVIADQYPPEKQTHLLGILNALIASSMAFAPVIGSYINCYFGWRGNFLTLLFMGVAAFLLCYAVLPQAKPNYNVSLSLKSYAPLLRSKTFLTYSFSITFTCIGYWVFIGISPILYMDDLGVPLKQFGFYQGINAGAFALTSMISSWMLKKFGRYACLHIGTYCAVLFALACIVVSVFVKDNPILIAFLMCGYSMGLVFPCNILYPICLEYIPDAKSRAAALVNISRLLLTGLTLQTVGYFYTHTFFCVVLFVTIPVFMGFLLIRLLPEWRHKEISQSVAVS
jgi:DHA1 family bicyclomycin/chloramphenicol resistance-like MFS transporter